MNFLQRLRAFFTRRRSQESASQSTQDIHPSPQAAPSTSVFHGVGTLTIIGGTFIVIGKRIWCRNHALSDKYQTAPAADIETPTSSRERESTTPSGAQPNDSDERG